ncbi:MAG: TerB family tellurite resistance protein [Pseudobacteriovorax sp.]|nr:TerB family tellurite resistance protein [Pseudobacteriovorax sp.]
MVFSKLQSLIKNALAAEDDSVSEDESKKLAIFGILYEAARSDFHVAEEEMNTIRAIMNRYFQISDDEFLSIKDKAEKIHDDSSGMFQISRDVRQHLNRDERLTLLDELWEIAFADGVLDPHESMIIRRLADLLGLEHKEFIDSKLKVSTRKSSE